MVTYCPRCGVQFPTEFLGRYWRASDRCGECALALGEVPAMLAPSDDEVVYGLDEWPTNDRTAVTAGLVAMNVRFRWEANLVLSVPAAAEVAVNQLLDEIESQIGVDEVATPEAVEAVESIGADGGPEAQQAMA